MATTVQKAIKAVRKDKADQVQALKDQWMKVRDEQAARRAELDVVTAELAELDAWILANP